MGTREKIVKRLEELRVRMIAFHADINADKNEYIKICQEMIELLKQLEGDIK
jgi:hypothetical protein